MPFFADMFLEPRKPIDYKGKTVYSADFIDGPKKFKAVFNVISTNSKYRQGFSLHMYEMKGKLIYDGNVIQKNGLSFFVDSIPHTIEIDVEIEEGFLFIENFCDNTGTGSMVAGFSGFAMIIEDIDDNKKRYYCNDFEPDDDFDDLIFEVQFIEG